MFLKFANFYYQFIQGFNKIAWPFISILKIANLWKNLLILVSISKKNKMVNIYKFKGKN